MTTLLHPLFSIPFLRSALAERYQAFCGSQEETELIERLFTPEKIAGIFGDLGAAQSKVMGFPVTVYPQKEETEIRGNSSQAKRIFSDEINVKRLFEIEKRLCPQQEAAARGNNLLCIATKPKKA